MRRYLLLPYALLTIFFSLSAVFSKPGNAFAAIQFVGSTTASGTNAAYNIDLATLTGGIASSPSQNDLVIIVNAYIGTTHGNPGVGTAGYTEMADIFQTDTNGVDLSVNRKFMGASPDGLVSCNGSGVAGNASECVALVLRGVDTTNPMDVASTTAQNNNAEDIDCPSITPLTAGTYVVCTGGAGGTSLDTAPNMIANYHGAYIQTDSTNAAAATAEYFVWSSGAEDPPAWVMDLGTANANGWAALTMALRALAPSVTTVSANAQVGSAKLFGNITNVGNGNVPTRGFVYGTVATLSGGDTATTTEAASFVAGAWSATITGLTSSVTYYYKAYATNGSTGYGAIKSFSAGDATPARRMRLFEGFKINVIGNTLKVIGS